MKEIQFEPETTTVWSFPERGDWATHTPSYRGNFAPQVARNIILRYSQPNDLVLDPMAGGGTTLIECKLLGRRFIGCDINPDAVAWCQKAVDFNLSPDKDRPVDRKSARQSKKTSDNLILCADARDLTFLPAASVDLILTHPPYLNVIAYSDGQISQDLSTIKNLTVFCDAIQQIAQELYRVLKPDHYCAILIGDTRRGGHYVPLAFRVMERFLRAGFLLKEDIIKIQHNCSATGRWKAKAAQRNFYLIMHEHLFVFRKPATGETATKLKDSACPYSWRAKTKK